MLKNMGLYPRVQTDTDGSAVVSQAGGDPRSGQGDHGFGGHAGVGGDCLADIAVLRAEPGVFGRVASDPTVSRTIDVLAADPVRALKAIDTARAAARARVWKLAGEQAPDHGVDADAR